MSHPNQGVPPQYQQGGRGYHNRGGYGGRGGRGGGRGGGPNMQYYQQQQFMRVNSAPAELDQDNRNAYIPAQYQFVGQNYAFAHPQMQMGQPGHIPPNAGGVPQMAMRGAGGPPQGGPPQGQPNMLNRGPPSAAAPSLPMQARERKVLAIVDPDTDEAIDMDQVKKEVEEIASRESLEQPAETAAATKQASGQAAPAAPKPETAAAPAADKQAAPAEQPAAAPAAETPVKTEEAAAPAAAAPVEEKAPAKPVEETKETAAEAQEEGPKETGEADKAAAPAAEASGDKDDEAKEEDGDDGDDDDDDEDGPSMLKMVGSTISVSGKRMYSAESLRAIRDLKAGKNEPPVHLANFADIYAGPGGPSSPKGGKVPKSGSFDRKSFGMRKTKSNDSFSHGGMRRNRSSRNNVERGPEYQLQNRSENPWKHGSAKDELDTLRRSVQSILNKLTPETFDKLHGQILNAGIDNAEKLNIVVQLIFDKALVEHNFSAMYSEMCRELAELKVTHDAESEKQKEMDFRRMLISRCQQEFERPATIDRTSEEFKDMAEEDIQYKEQRLRHGRLGNMKFIGQLFLKDLLAPKITQMLIRKLLYSSVAPGTRSEGDVTSSETAVPPDENIELLCALLNTTGKKLDRDFRQYVDIFFARLKELSMMKDRYNSRLRFMIKDLLELRDRRWVPRRKIETAKKLDEVRREAVEAEARKQAEVRRMGSGFSRGSKSSYPPPPSSRDQSAPPPPSQNRSGSESSGWTSVSSSRQPRGSNTPQLRPSGGFSFRQTNSGYKALDDSSNASGGDGSSEALRQTNSFSALSESSEVSGGKARNDSGRSSPVSNDSRPTSPAAEPVTGELAEKKVKAMLDEFVSNPDLKEAVLCLDELNNRAYHGEAASVMFIHVSEASDKHREACTDLFVHLVDKKKLTVDDLRTALKMILEQSFEYGLSIDIPHFYKYVGHMFGSIAARCSEESIKEWPIAYMEVVAAAIEEKSMTIREFIMMYTEFCDCLNELKDEDLAMVLSSPSYNVWSHLGALCGGKLDVVREKAYELFKELRTREALRVVPSVEVFAFVFDDMGKKAVTCEKILSDLTDDVSGDLMSTPTVAGSLVSGVCFASIAGENTVEHEAGLLKACTPIFKRFVSSAECRMLAVSSIAKVAEALKFPEGLLSRLFQCFLDNEVVLRDDFVAWKQGGSSTDEMQSAASEFFKSLES